jgi:hypothetical protein
VYYDSSDLMSFELNEETIDVLHSFALLNETLDRDAAVLIDDCKVKQAEYLLEGKIVRSSSRNDAL